MCTRDRKLELDFSNQGKVTVFYKEVASASNQVLEISFKAFEGGFTDGTGYFYIVTKDNHVPIMRSELLKYTHAPTNQKDNCWGKAKVAIKSLVDEVIPFIIFRETNILI